MSSIFKKTSFIFLSLLSFICFPLKSEPTPQNWKDNTIFVFPNAGRGPWLDAINSAEKSINIAAYKLSDPIIVQALQKARERDVAVNLLIEPYTFAHKKSENVKSPIGTLKEMGVNVFNLSPRFNQAHYKMIIVDGKAGLISTGNLDAESFDGIPQDHVPAARDFAVAILNPSILSAMERTFTADIHNTRVVPNDAPLVWGPDQQRSTFLSLVNSAQESIHIYQQDFQDVGIAQAVAGAARANVKVKVLMMPFPFSKKEDKNIPNQTLLTEAGAEVVLNSDLYIHAKILIIDGKVMYLGSGNFYPSAIDQTRELGILLTDPKAIGTVLETFQQDWEKSGPFTPPSASAQ